MGSWGCLGGVLRRSWGVVEQLGGVSEGSWGALERSLGSWKVLGPILGGLGGALEGHEASWSGLGALLRVSWGLSGASWGVPEGVLGQPWGKEGGRREGEEAQGSPGFESTRKSEGKSGAVGALVHARTRQQTPDSRLQTESLQTPDARLQTAQQHSSTGQGSTAAQKHRTRQHSSTAGTLNPSSLAPRWGPADICIYIYNCLGTRPRGSRAFEECRPCLRNHQNRYHPRNCRRKQLSNLPAKPPKSLQSSRLSAKTAFEPPAEPPKSL